MLTESMLVEGMVSIEGSWKTELSETLDRSVLCFRRGLKVLAVSVLLRVSLVRVGGGCDSMSLKTAPRPSTVLNLFFEEGVWDFGEAGADRATVCIRRDRRDRQGRRQSRSLNGMSMGSGRKLNEGGDRRKERQRTQGDIYISYG